MQNARRLLFPVLMLVLLCTACGRHATSGMYYCMEGMQLLWIEADGTRVEGVTFSKCQRAELVDWNGEDALVYVQYETERGEVLWELLLCTVPRSPTLTQTLVLTDVDFLAEGGGAVLTEDYFVVVFQYASGEQAGKQLFRASCRTERNLQFFPEYQQWSLAQMTGTDARCTGLFSTDERTVTLQLSDGSQLRYDPVTRCLLEAEEPAPEQLPQPEPQRVADGFAVEGKWLLKDGARVRDLSTLEIKTVGISPCGGAPIWSADDFLEAFIEGVTEDALVIRARWRNKSYGNRYYEAILPLSLTDYQDIPGGMKFYDPSEWFCILDGQALYFEWEIQMVEEYGPMEMGDKVQYGYISRITAEDYILTELDFAAQENTRWKVCDVFGVQPTGALAAHGDVLIFAFEDGSIRSFCPKTGETCTLLAPDAERGSIWKLGIDGDTLCWYELFQRGGQMHRMKLK